MLNGIKLNFDVPAQIVDDRVMVPLRGVFEKMGAAVLWDQELQMVTAVRGDSVIKIAIGDPQALVNKSPVPLDVPATISDGRTMVPLRFVSESLGAKVEWSGKDKTAVRTTSWPPLPEGSLTMRDILENPWYLAGTQAPFMFNPDDFASINDNWPDYTGNVYYLYEEGSNVLRLVDGSGVLDPDHYFTFYPSERRMTEYLNGAALTTYSLDKPKEKAVSPTPAPTLTPAATETPTPTKTQTPSPTPTAAPTKAATLHLVFSESDNLVKNVDYFHTVELTANDLCLALSEATGLVFEIEGVEETSDGIAVDWSPSATLLQGLGANYENTVYSFNDTDSLNWFMMDSMYYTLQEHLNQINIYFTANNGGPLIVPCEGGKNTFSKDTPYLGSSFYIAHSNKAK
jgi:hypothetical protein